MSETAKDSSLSVVSVSALLTVPVAAVPVHRGSAQAREHNFKPARQAVDSQQLAVPLLPHPLRLGMLKL